MLILVVDDDPIACEMLAHTLQEVGHDVHMCSDGAEAWRVLNETDIRLMITDWEMPEMNGIELCKKVRDGSLNRYVYTVILTAHGSDEDVIAGLDAGADDFLVKPFNPEEVKVRVRAGERLISLETRDIVIFTLAKLADSRDPETGAHLERIQSYCEILTNALDEGTPYSDEITGEFKRAIVTTSALHDIGKVGIPDSVLLKPGRLSEQEFEIMRQHTVIGGETLKAALDAYPNAAYLRMAYEIAISHHERWDGNGYPHKLKELEIPLSARICALADVYDALTSRRVYKDAFTHTVAKNIIEEGNGTHFDPVIVDAFLAVESKIIEAGQRINAEADED